MSDISNADTTIGITHTVNKEVWLVHNVKAIQIMINGTWQEFTLDTLRIILSKGE